MVRSDNTEEMPRDKTSQLPRTVAIRHTRRVVIAVVGGALIALAILIIPVPGPWSFILGIAGLTILSWEFLWARRLLDRARAKFREFRQRVRSR